MHGREQREGENHRRIVIPSRGCSQHMRSVPSNSTRTSIADADSSLVSTTTITTFISADYFCKVLPWWVFPKICFSHVF